LNRAASSALVFPSAESLLISSTCSHVILDLKPFFTLIVLTFGGFGGFGNFLGIRFSQVKTGPKTVGWSLMSSKKKQFKQVLSFSCLIMMFFA
jgi:hypothetical protein